MPLPSPTPTRPSLLIRIRDPLDRAAWDEFVSLYAPLIYRFARRGGLQDADAADVVQDVLRGVSRAIGRLEYDPARGNFRTWLFAATRNALINARIRRPALGCGGSSAQRRLEDVPAPGDDDEDAWEREYRRQRFLCAAERARVDFEESTWSAFWATAVENRPAREAAETLGLSIGAVYIAKSRVLARLRSVQAELEQELG